MEDFDCFIKKNSLRQVKLNNVLFRWLKFEGESLKMLGNRVLSTSEWEDFFLTCKTSGP